MNKVRFLSLFMLSISSISLVSKSAAKASKAAESNSNNSKRKKHSIIYIQQFANSSIFQKLQAEQQKIKAEMESLMNQVQVISTDKKLSEAKKQSAITPLNEELSKLDEKLTNLSRLLQAAVAKAIDSVKSKILSQGYSSITFYTSGEVVYSETYLKEKFDDCTKLFLEELEQELLMIVSKF